MHQLPINEYRSAITDALRNGRNLIIKAPTGSGKSTQVPQFLLDAAMFDGRILVLQPRRLAARMLAARVAQERGDEPGAETGFQTRFESAVSDASRVIFITEGILPRMLLNNRDLAGVSAVIFDEFHERNLATDIGLALVTHLQRTRRPDLRIIIMSATIDTAPLAAYLGSAGVIDCPGRLHPIDIRYVPVPKGTPCWEAASQATATLIARGTQGDLLVFMPGAYEIRRCREALERSVRSEPVMVVPLYGDLPATQQHQVMEPSPRRKIVVATNIAETSLTIPGVRHVIDSGLARISRYDPARGFSTLPVEPVSRDSADQRSGRAGREAPGICIRLWSEASHAGRAHRTAPEIARVDLADTCLQLYQLGFGSAETFPWFEAPAPAALRAARELLIRLGALTSDNTLTGAGRSMSRFPMHPRLARLLIEAGKRSAVQCATFTAALLSERSAVSGKPDFPDEATRQELLSDPYAHFCLLEKIRRSGFDPALCTRYGVNSSATRAIFRTQALFMQYCRREGMPHHDADDAPEQLARCLLATFPDHLAVRIDKGTLMCNLREGRRGELAKESIARSARCIVAADIREMKNPKGELKTTLSLATEIKEAWLSEDFPHEMTTRTVQTWNSVAQAVETRQQFFCLDVLISDKPAPEDRAAASALLADTIFTRKLPILSWDAHVDEWIQRVQWVGQLFPEQGLPEFTEEDRLLAVHELCAGATRLADIKNREVLPILEGFLDAQQRRFIEAMAPPYLVLASGRKMRLAYEPGSAPRGRARIQDLFDLRTTPKIAAGRAGVLIEILAPNNRPVQITEDLACFWDVHYPELKKALSRRYPRHEWR